MRESSHFTAGHALLWPAVWTLLLVGCGTPEPGTGDTSSTASQESSKQTSSVEEATPAVEMPEIEMPEIEMPEIQALPPGEAEDGGYTIAQVMELGHDSKLYRLLYRETFPEEALKQLKTLYADLPKRVPPKGEEADWKARATALVQAVDAIEQHEPDGVAKLKRAVNCNSCHNRHKG